MNIFAEISQKLVSHDTGFFELQMYCRISLTKLFGVVFCECEKYLVLRVTSTETIEAPEREEEIKMNTIARTIAFVLAMFSGFAAQAAPEIGETKEGYYFMYGCESPSDGASVDILENGADPRYHEFSVCVMNKKGALTPMLCKDQWCGVPRAKRIEMPKPEDEFGRPRYYVDFFEPCNEPCSQWVELQLDVSPDLSLIVVTVKGLTDAEWWDVQALP